MKNTTRIDVTGTRGTRIAPPSEAAEARAWVEAAMARERAIRQQQRRVARRTAGLALVVTTW